MQRTRNRITYVLLLIVAIVACISAALTFEDVYAAGYFDPIRVPGGVVTDDASFSAALGGHALIPEENEIILNRDVILESPIVIKGGEYVFNGAGCQLTRGFEEGDLIVLQDGAKMDLGKARKEGEDVSLILSGGVSCKMDESKNLVLCLTVENLSIDPRKVAGSLIRIGKDCEVTLYRGTELVDNHSVISGAGVICDGGGFVFADGILSGCSTDADGGNILVLNGGAFAMATGELKNGIAGDKGGNLAIYEGGEAGLAEGTISGGNAKYGGGIYAGGNLVIQSTVIETNYAEQGGGIYYAANNSLSGGNIQTNSAVSGGGIYNVATDLQLTLVGASSNLASFGGGIYNAGIMTITDGYIANNIATEFGGGIYNAADAEMTMLAGTISASNAPHGGGIYNAGICILKGCSIATNTGDQGPGIMNEARLEVYSNFYCSSGNPIFLVLGENGAGTITVIESMLSAKYPILVPAVRDADGTYRIEHNTETALLSGNAEAIRDVASRFTVAKQGSTSYALTQDGYIKVQFNWILPVVIGVIAVVGIAAAVLILRRRRKAQ